MKLEVIAQNTQDVTRINQTNADRIELCSNMEFGGYTPYKHTIDDACLITDKPITVMVRRHHDNFLITEEQLEEILEDIKMVQSTKAKGIVFGAITEENTIDTKALKAVVEAAKGLEITFHKAFDHVENKIEGIKTLKKHGITRVLTSGGPGNPVDNINTIKELLKLDFEILIGGSVSKENIREILAAGVKNIHVGSAIREMPTEKDLAIGETQEIVIKPKDKRKKPTIKIIEPRPFNP